MITGEYCWFFIGMPAFDDIEDIKLYKARIITSTAEHDDLEVEIVGLVWPLDKKSQRNLISVGARRKFKKRRTALTKKDLDRLFKGFVDKYYKHNENELAFSNEKADEHKKEVAAFEQDAKHCKAERKRIRDFYSSGYCTGQQDKKLTDF